MSVTELLKKIADLKAQLKAGSGNSAELKKNLSDTKNALDKIIASENLETVIAAFENWIAENPGDKHVEMKLQKIKSQR